MQYLFKDKDIKTVVTILSFNKYIINFILVKS